MKEEALKLAVWLENMSKLGWADNFGQELDETSAMIRRLVEELDKQGEPFCYLCDWGKTQDGENRQEFYYKTPACALEEDWNEHPKIHDNLPLYTTPQTKPLSDEKILSIADKRRARINNDIGNDLLLISFARAIEERHGIK